MRKEVAVHTTLAVWLVAVTCGLVTFLWYATSTYPLGHFPGLVLTGIISLSVLYAVSLLGTGTGWLLWAKHHWVPNPHSRSSQH